MPLKKGHGPGSICQRYGPRDPDPHQLVTDPQHWVPDYRTYSVVIILQQTELLPSERCWNLVVMAAPSSIKFGFIL